MGLRNRKIGALPFVKADLNYLAPLDARPRTYAYEVQREGLKTNVVPEPHELPVHDARPVAESISLDIEGFELVR